MPRRQGRGPRGPGRGGGGMPQLEWARLAVLGVGILVVLLIGWLLVRAFTGGSSESPTEKYFGSVTTVLRASDATGRALRKQLLEPNQTAAKFTTQLQADLAKAKSQLSQAEGIKPTKELELVHPYLLQTLLYRVNGLQCMVDEIGAAVKESKAIAAGRELAQCQQRLLSSDVIYADSYAAAAQQALKAHNISAQVPSSRFVSPTQTALVLPRNFGLLALRMKPGPVTGLHGMELVSVTAQPGSHAITGTSLVRLKIKDLQFVVVSKNSGKFPEVDVPVKLTLTNPGSHPITRSAVIPSVQPGGSATVKFANIFSSSTQPLFTHPYGLRVMVGPVPGEHNLSNNRLTATVSFEIS